MTKQKINPSVIAFIAIIFVSAVIRMLNVSQLRGTEFSHFSPLAAMCLFTGSYFKNQWKAVLFTVLAMFISDIFIQQIIYKGQYGFIYGGWYWVYGVFVLITFLGKYMINKVNIQNVLGASIIAAVGHWLVMDFIVWLGGATDVRTNFTTLLPKNWAGLQQCYIQGIPFMRNLLIGTIAYSSVMFGLFAWYKSTSTKTQTIAAQ